MSGLSSQYTVLIVDDDPLVLASFRRLARNLPTRLACASTLQEAEQMVAAEVPAIIISDYRMPDGDGITFLEKVHAKHPSVKRILYTGEAVLRTSWGVDIPVLGKPCSPDELRDLIVSLLGDLETSQPR